jgi:hypothetical protein
MEDNTVTILSDGWFWMYRNVEDRHFLGIVDHRMGPAIKEVNFEDIQKMKKHPQFPYPVYKDDNTVAYNQECPYTEDQIRSFANLNLPTLEEWAARGF